MGQVKIKDKDGNDKDVTLTDAEEAIYYSNMEMAKALGRLAAKPRGL